MENPFEAPLHKQNFTDYLRQETQNLAVGESKYIIHHGKSRPVFMGLIHNAFKDRKFRSKPDNINNDGWWIKRVQ
jgi:hypothetical protein